MDVAVDRVARRRRKSEKEREREIEREKETKESRYNADIFNKAQIGVLDAKQAIVNIATRTLNGKCR